MERVLFKKVTGFEESLRTSLIRTVAQLETLPEDLKEHPGSGGLVKNLINPSLYPFAKGQSLIIPEDKAPRDGCSVRATNFVSLLSPIENPNAAQEIFGRLNRGDFDDTYQWLPSDVWIDADGKARFLSYINNLNPVDYAEAYTNIEAIFSKLLPHFEVILDDEKDNRGNEDDAADDPDYEEEARKARLTTKAKGALKVAAKAKAALGSAAKKAASELRSRRLQVIVKMFNTELTPENPTYPGGEWHIEGRDNESIKAVGLYYYSVSNIKTSSLELQERRCRGDKDDNKAFRTTEKSCIVFRNDCFKHRVKEYTLDDATKPGYRKVLAFFLCNPKKEVLSTGRVPPQQREWYLRELKEASTVPPEILEMITSGLAGTITKESALNRRTAMLKKRDLDAKRGYGRGGVRKTHD